MIPKPVLIVGGSGTLSLNLIPWLLNDSSVSRVRCLSRGEHRQIKCAALVNSNRVDWLVGDVRDRERMRWAVNGCQSVFHFAAMKSVDKAEYDPEEAIKTNIQGTINVIDVCREEGVKKAIFTSTDKAVAPVNLYGATKLVAEKAFIQGNVGNSDSRFSVCRYGNVLSSQGSVVEVWAKEHQKGRGLLLTDPCMTRFFISQKDAARFVYSRWADMCGGEVFIPKMKATNMFALMTDLFPEAKYNIVGRRPGEKMHEVLLSEDEREFVTDCGDYWIRWPSDVLFPIQRRGVAFSSSEIGYRSDSAPQLTVEEVREMMCTS